MSEYDVPIEGLRIHVRDIGEGTPLLAINGLGAPTSWWATLEARLEGRRVISFDAPGVGRSQTPWRPVDPRQLAAIAAGVLDARGVQRADVLGYSLGGMVAQELAIRGPARVKRLILAATSCGLGAVPASLLHLLNMATPLRYFSGTLFEHTSGGMLGGRARTDPQFLEEHKQRRFGSRPSVRGYSLQVMSLQRWTSLSRLGRITAPTLVIAGDDDPLIGAANGFLLARRIPDARLWIAIGEGHLLMMDPESAAFDAIAGFLDGDWGDAVAVDDAAVAAAPRALAAATGGHRRRPAAPAPGAPRSARWS